MWDESTLQKTSKTVFGHLVYSFGPNFWAVLLPLKLQMRNTRVPPPAKRRGGNIFSTSKFRGADHNINTSRTPRYGVISSARPVEGFVSVLHIFLWCLLHTLHRVFILSPILLWCLFPFVFSLRFHCICHMCHSSRGGDGAGGQLCPPTKAWAFSSRRDEPCR